jgi:serine/threonine protein kinase
MPIMPLRRRRPFPQSGTMEVTARSSIVCHMERSPEDDYYKLESSPTAESESWVGEHRSNGSRQLAVIQTVKGEAFSDFRFLAKIPHPNITRILALYHHDNAINVAYEFVSLDLFDICPLFEPEIAEVMSQVRELIFMRETD